VRLLKPTTFMNESGRAVGEAVRFFKLRTAHVYTFYDDLDLTPGKCRVKIGGGAGGHNGLRSLDAHIGKEYWRVRLGIGHPGHKDRVLGYVLKDFAKEEQASWLPKLLDAVAAEAELLVQGEENAFMSRVSQAVFPPPPKPARPPQPASNAQENAAAASDAPDPETKRET
jgi:PTH1 family peptidyl-tRNA hydrolase